MTFKKKKKNLIAYLESVQEDKQTLASLKIQELYFNKNEDQKTPSFGEVSDLEKLTASDLNETYRQMLEEDCIDIFVVGDLSPEVVQKEIAQLPFAQGLRQTTDIFYRQPLENQIREEKLTQEVLQAKLNLAYATNIYYDDRKRYPLMIFNGLFGGFPHSKLFLNVREKASLAYYASSSVDTFRGLMTVQTGIDGKNRSATMALIEAQLASLQRGEISDEELAKTKAMLKNQYLLSLDNPQSLIETKYLENWLPETKQTQKQFLNHIMSVTKEEVQEVAQQVSLEAVFFLDGE